MGYTYKYPRLAKYKSSRILILSCSPEEPQQAKLLEVNFLLWNSYILKIPRKVGKLVPGWRSRWTSCRPVRRRSVKGRQVPLDMDQIGVTESVRDIRGVVGRCWWSETTYSNIRWVQFINLENLVIFICFPELLRRSGVTGWGCWDGLNTSQSCGWTEQVLLKSIIVTLNLRKLC